MLRSYHAGIYSLCLPLWEIGTSHTETSQPNSTSSPAYKHIKLTKEQGFHATIADLTARSAEMSHVNAGAARARYTVTIQLHIINPVKRFSGSCGWESLMKSVTLGNVTMSHRTRERPPNALRLSHSTMIGLRAALEN
ncbi:hypothetical protein EVAR_45460_1 [Eumeta japonica]|uniref:Uncharacterized protein n=1 Tax=Eumeta variegata TaxID=151549 RepID=A0A4C1SRL7_EUMVA|nr:hypothetical protein EVAR_45460_1 [Eumeta japonica]